MSAAMTKRGRAARLAVVLLVAASASPAAAQVLGAPRAVLELFTSQGCSSCPPADALLAELAGRDDVVALAYHVDYWDYIGWADTFGNPAHSAHQRGYADSWGGGRIYTPQLVINGTVGVVGSRRDEVEAAIEGAELAVPVRIEAGDGVLGIAAEGKPDLPEAVVWLVTYKERAEVLIERGENAGRRMRYARVVTGRQMIGMWEPNSGAHLKLPASEVLPGPGEGAVVLIQQQDGALPGQIVGAGHVAP